VARKLVDVMTEGAEGSVSRSPDAMGRDSPPGQPG
jgi:hypothetical protein